MGGHALGGLVAFEEATGITVPLPRLIPRRWGWVAGITDRSDGDAGHVELEVVPRANLNPETVALHYRKRPQHGAQHDDEPPWPWLVKHRAVAEDGDLEVRCETTQADPRALPEFLDALLPSPWRIEERPPPPPLPASTGPLRGYHRWSDEPSAPAASTDQSDKLPSVIHWIERATLSELPSLTVWPHRLGVLAATRFSTFGVDPFRAAWLHDVGMHLHFVRREPMPLDIGLRLSRRPDDRGEQVGPWRVSLAATSEALSDDEVAALIAALAASLHPLAP